MKAAAQHFRTPFSSRRLAWERLVSLAVIGVFLVSPAWGKEWARKMFETTDHDSGVVARGALAEFEFELQNIYKEDVHIAAVRSSCGCTTPTILKHDLKTWEKGGIRAKFNTRSFLGQKHATITVTIDRPFSAEVQLNVHGFIRQDVVLQPGDVDFGEITMGSPVDRVIAINYAGRETWRIEDVETPDYYQVKLRETRRERGLVGYEMLVRLKPDAPEGHVNDELILVTNDQSMERIPFLARGRVVTGISVSPTALSLGVLRPGEKVTKQLFVRSDRQFKITKVFCEGDCLTFKNPSGAKSRHFIPVTFTGGDEPGELLMTIHIQTDLGPGAEVTCIATASVRD